MSIILKNANYYDFRQNKIFFTNILVEENEKQKLKYSTDVNDLLVDQSDVRIIDCFGKLVMHSFVNAHHHSYVTLTRTNKLTNIDDFDLRLKTGAWKIDQFLDADTLEACALYSAMESLRNGTTCIIEHHSSQNFIRGSLEVIEKAFKKVGMQFLPCFEISDRKSFSSSDEGLDYTDSWLSFKPGLVGLHSSFTVGATTLKNAIEIANKHKTGIHIHVAESTLDQELCLKEYGTSVVERLYDAGALENKKTILAHAIHLSNEEAELIKNSGVYVVENMESNLRSNVGFFNSDGLGDNIMLGTDGMHGNMLRSAKMAFLAGQGFDQIDPYIAIKRLRTGNNYFLNNKLSGDDENNLIIFNYPASEEITSKNIAMHMIFGIESMHITHVISKGQLVVENGKLTMINEEDTMLFIRQMTKKLIQKLSKQ
ncbi:MAG: amidohydrolase family protein [Bacteroidales bacterium]|jgi:cytosine/adenosine deaminase-related metal-dependent hydrolase|nr:amidohydrolase family protein [Bacteroidales bacterium]